MAGRDYVGPEDIQAVAPDVLRHRLVLSFEAEADGVVAKVHVVPGQAVDKDQVLLEFEVPRGDDAG